MKHAFWLLALWLGCTPWGVAWDQTKPEVLTYRVAWGPLALGQAALAFTPGAFEAYALEARVKDDSAFMDINDRWRTEGVWREGRWQPRMHHILQAENDYRADKTITFKGNKALYKNNRGGEPDLNVDLPEGARDALSTLYDLRAQGREALNNPRTIQVMGVKKAFPLEIKPAVVGKGKKGHPNLLRVDMYAHNVEKKRMDRWRIWLTDDADLVPTRIEARLKIGTLVAVLNNRK